MAIKMSALELETFKKNLDLLQPYNDHRLLDRLSKSLYQSSDYHYEVITGLESAICINKIQMYSRHSLEKECRALCNGIPLPDFYNCESMGQKYLDQVEFQLYPKRQAIREEQRAQQKAQSAENAAALAKLEERPAPQRVDTSSFPAIAQSLNIYSATDAAFTEHASPLTVTIYGVAAGHLAEYIHSHYPEVDINMVIINPAVTAIMLCLDPDMGKRLANSHVHLFWGTDETPVIPKSIVLPAEVNLAPEVNPNLKQRLVLANEHNYNKLLAAKRSRNINSVLAAYNFVYTKLAPQLRKDTFNRCDNIALLMSGPSLIDCYPKVKALRDKGIRLMACDSALPALEQMKIVPDIVVANDVGLYAYAGPRLEGSFVSPKAPRFLTHPEIYEKSSLIFTSKTHLLIPALFSGKKYIIYTKDMQRRDVKMDPEALTDLDLGSFCSLLMFDLALRQGAQKIYLFGFDTIPRIDSYHAGFDMEYDKEMMLRDGADYVPCNDGQMRKALHCYTRARLMFEKKLHNTRGISVINCSPYGAMIKGTILDVETKPIELDAKAIQIKEAEKMAAKAKLREARRLEKEKKKAATRKRGRTARSSIKPSIADAITAMERADAEAAAVAAEIVSEASESELVSSMASGTKNLTLHSALTLQRARLDEMREAREAKEKAELLRKRLSGATASTTEAMAIASEAAAAIKALVGVNPDDEDLGVVRRRRRRKLTEGEVAAPKGTGQHRRLTREELLSGADNELFKRTVDKSRDDDDDYYSRDDEPEPFMPNFGGDGYYQSEDDDYGDGNTEH